MALNDIQRRQRRAKQEERDLGKHLIEGDGPDPLLRPGGGIASSTGRVGMITAMQYDVVSRTYAAESKLVRMPSILLGWWVQICQVAEGAGKEPLLWWTPSNEDAPRAVKTLVAITESRHKDLLAYERLFLDKQSTAPKALGYSKADQVAKSPGQKKKEGRR